MLDRILNINPQEKYKSGLKIPSSHNYIVNRHEHDRHHSKDSALFSPLAKLMSKINWTILNVEFLSNDEILFNFVVDDLEFETIVNFNEMYTSMYHNFSISRIRNQGGKNFECRLEMKVEKYEINVLNKPDPIKIGNLSLVFDRIEEINIHSETKIVEPGILSEFTKGIESNLNNELNYILQVLYTFISTKNKSRVKNNFVLKTIKNNPIIMQKVAIIYAE